MAPEASMAQYFPLSAAARTLSLKVIFSSADEEASYRRFCRLRWPETDGAPGLSGLRMR
ncbi:hypothetical protein [Paracoccus aminovorans]|uniref:hypothetical protein n=1 Tax=Paracoccus aminovorans TaxID=34004 RepID=UPI0038CD8F2B